MLLNDCNPRLTARGHLEFDTPGFGRSTGWITPWSDGFRTFRLNRGRAVPTPHPSLVVLAGHDGDGEVGDFLTQIPRPVREAMRRFEAGQCTMLRWIAHYPAAMDLCVSNPKLLWLLAVAVRDARVREEQIARLLRERQVKILARLCGGASKASLRLLKKTALRDGSLEEARVVLHALRRPLLWRLLAHDAAVDVALLDLLRRHPPLCLPGDGNVIAIDTAEAIATEARLQNNCVKRFAPAIASGEVYLYKVLRPHRATLSVVHTDDGWEIGEVKLSHNRHPGPKLVAVASAWLRSATAKIDDDVP